MKNEAAQLPAKTEHRELKATARAMWKPEKAQSAGWTRMERSCPKSNAGMPVKLRLFRIGATLDLRRGLTCWNLTLGVRSWCPRKMSRWARRGADSPGHVNGGYNIYGREV